LDKTTLDTGLFLQEVPAGIAGTAAVEAPSLLPPGGKFAGSFDGYVVVPQPMVEPVLQYTEADPAAFGSFAAMGQFGSFELRHTDAVSSAALATWPGVVDFYYGREKHLVPVLEALAIPIIPLKRDFLHAYERVITELGQL
jgi:hypothetical protein